MTFVLRPFRLQTWRELAYLLLGSLVDTIFDKLDLAPAEGDHRRVLAVLAYLRASG